MWVGQFLLSYRAIEGYVVFVRALCTEKSFRASASVTIVYN
jgi:hypothetical protein